MVKKKFNSYYPSISNIIDKNDNLGEGQASSFYNKLYEVNKINATGQNTFIGNMNIALGEFYFPLDKSYPALTRSEYNKIYKDKVDELQKKKLKEEVNIKKAKKESKSMRVIDAIIALDRPELNRGKGVNRAQIKVATTDLPKSRAERLLTLSEAKEYENYLKL